MKFQQILNSPLFFNNFIKNDIVFNSLKDKFPDIFADLLSSRSNPNCSCKNRVRSYLNAKLVEESKYFEDLLNKEEIKDFINSDGQMIFFNQIENRRLNPIQSRNNNGKIFEIGKTEEDWKNLCKQLEMEKITFKSFSVVEKEDKLIVYFI